MFVILIRSSNLMLLPGGTACQLRRLGLLPCQGFAAVRQSFAEVCQQREQKSLRHPQSELQRRTRRSTTAAGRFRVLGVGPEQEDVRCPICWTVVAEHGLEMLTGRPDFDQNAYKDRSQADRAFEQMRNFHCRFYHKSFGRQWNLWQQCAFKHTEWEEGGPKERTHMVGR